MAGALRNTFLGSLRLFCCPGEPTIKVRIIMSKPKSSYDASWTREDLKVIPWSEWYRSKGISKDTAKRLRKKGKGPRIVQRSDKLIGVTVGDDREWTAGRILEGE